MAVTLTRCSGDSTSRMVTAGSAGPMQTTATFDRVGLRRLGDFASSFLPSA